MFLTNSSTGVVVYVGYVFETNTEFGASVYKTPECSYSTFCHDLWDVDVDVVANKNTYIDGVIGINPDWAEPEEPTTPEPTQMDRIESMLTTLTSDTVSADSISTAIEEGVNEV